MVKKYGSVNAPLGLDLGRGKISTYNGSRQKGSAMVRLSNQSAPPEVILSTGQLAIPDKHKRFYCIYVLFFNT